MPVLLYDSKTRSVKLREERRLRLIENWTRRRISAPNRDENVEWGWLHNEETHSVYHTPYIVSLIKFRRMRWAGQVARIEKYMSS